MKRSTGTRVLASVGLLLAGASKALALDVNGTGDAAWYWHERYHGFLSMATYGDYNTTCQQVFTAEAQARNFPDSTEAPWTVLQDWGPTPSGLKGFIVVIPEMGKVVTVFNNILDFQRRFNASTTSIGPGSALNLNCQGCTAHAGAVQAYLEARTATNNFELAWEYINRTGKQWSSTGHQFGGMVSQLLCLEHGLRNGPHYCHSHGSPRVFNPAAAAVFNNVQPELSNQRVVANEDSFPEVYPESADYTHVLTGFHIYGTNPTYGMNQAYCGASDDPECLGGTVASDSWFYYTPIGNCGNRTSPDPTGSQAILRNLSAYYSTASFGPSSTSSSVAPTSTQVTVVTTSAPAATTSPARQSQGTGAAVAITSNGALAGVGMVAALVLGSAALL